MLSEHVKEILGKITPINCEAYLKNKGWFLTDNLGSVAKYYGKAGIGDVLVPLNAEASDYTLRIYELAKSLQEFENRQLEYIANDIVLSKYDIFRITAFKGESISNLPLEAASALIDKSLAMMASAARSLNTPQAYFIGQTKKVNEFISKLRLGHTERGSFVLSIQTPIAPSIPIQEMESVEEDTFERQATTRLCSLISIANSFASTLDEKSIKDSVDKGMSSNFIEALAGITDVCGDSGVNLDMTWASVRPRHDKNTKNTFHIKREITGILREVGKTLKTRLPQDNAEIEGFITTLHKEENSDFGNIKIRVSDPDFPKVIHVENLKSNEYEKAVDAHKNDKMVILKGHIQQVAQKSVMKDAYFIQV